MSSRPLPPFAAGAPALDPDAVVERASAIFTREAEKLATWARTSDAAERLLAHLTPGAPKLGDQAPLLRCVAAVGPGEDARATFRVANDGPDACDVYLYCTNFVGESGADIPSLRVAATPRRTTVPARGEVAFEVVVAVPLQTPPGSYSGLLQAAGAQYAKAVLTVEVT